MKKQKMGRRAFLLWSGGGVASLALVGCGVRGNAQNGGQTAPGSSSTVEYWDWDYAPRAQLLEAITTEWQQANPNVTLVRQALPYSDAQTKLLTATQSGNNPPFANVHSTWRFAMQRAGQLAPYPADLLPFDQMLSTPYNRDPASQQLYTSTFNYFTDQIFFNTDHLAEEGIDSAEVPTTWDDFFRFTEQLTRRDSNGQLTRAGWSLNHYYSRQWLWQTLVYQQGGWLYNEAGDQAQWNSPEGVQALQMIQDVYHKQQVDDVENLSLFDAFGTGAAATYISQGYTGASIDTDYPDMQGKWSTATTPTFSGRPDPAWGFVSPEEGFCVFANASTEEQEIAFSFIQAMLGSDERALDWAILQGGPPDRADLLDHPRLKEEDRNRVIETQAQTLPWRVNAGEQPLQAEKYWRLMFDRVLLQEEAPQAVLDDVTNTFNNELRASGERPLITERNYQPPA